MSIFASLLTSA